MRLALVLDEFTPKALQSTVTPNLKETVLVLIDPVCTTLKLEDQFVALTSAVSSFW